MSTSPHFDWVRARSNCSVTALFDALNVATKQDVESVTQLLQEARNSRVYIQHLQDRRVITVLRQCSDVVDPDQSQVTVRFVLSSHEIAVERQGTKMFSVIPSLNANRECKAMVNNQEYEVWQVCRMALDELFFEV
jgi:hypothetical protein